jgi:hypothetical protein
MVLLPSLARPMKSEDAGGVVFENRDLIGTQFHPATLEGHSLGGKDLCRILKCGSFAGDKRRITRCFVDEDQSARSGIRKLVFDFKSHHPSFSAYVAVDAAFEFIQTSPVLFHFIHSNFVRRIFRDPSV